MPSVSNPRHFETGRLVLSKFDNFMKWASSEAVIDEVGDAASTAGYVTLVYLDGSPDLFKRYVLLGTQNGILSTEEGLEEYHELMLGVSQGWYVTLQDDNALIWAFEFGSGTLAEEQARDEFIGSSLAYDAWLEQDADQI